MAGMKMLKSFVPCLFAAFLWALPPASAAILFAEDFSGHSTSGGAAGTNGWTGGDININASPNFSGSNVLDGNDASGTVDGFAFVERQFGNLSGTGGVHEFSVDVFGQTASLPSHNSAMGLGSSVSASSNRSGAYWLVLFDKDNIPGNTGYFFDARGITGSSSAFESFNGPFNQIETLRIVLDANLGEVYGVYDFGGSMLETTHFAVGSAQIGAIDEVFGFSDFRSANPGGAFANTGLGSQFSGAQWDNILVSSDAISVLEPGALLTFALGLISISLQRRREKP